MTSVDVDIEPLLDEQKIRLFHVVVVCLSIGVLFIDGYDLFIVGSIAPAIASHFHVPPAAMGEVFLFQQIGIAVGAFATGPLADRFGRKRILLLCLCAFGPLMLVSVFSRTLLELAILRAVSGLFLSGVLPTVMALITEFSPRRYRASFVTLLLAGYGVGTAASAAVAGWLLKDYGWQSGFWIGGLVPITCIPLVMWLMPESIQYRVRRRPDDPSVGRTLRRMIPSLAFDGRERFSIGGAAATLQQGNPLDVFAPGRRLASVLLWVMFFLAMGDAAVLSSWTVTYFKELAGIPIEDLGRLLTVGSLAAVVGNVIAGALLDRFSAIVVLTACFAGLTITVAALGQLPFGVFAFAAALSCRFAFSNAGVAGLSVLTARYYPPDVRATGFGLGFASGRVGGIIGPAMGGLVLTQGVTLKLTFLLVAIPPFLVILLLFAFAAVNKPPRPGSAVA
jgi:MFS transporter, AAHS family, 4-hydroxybenzoate transporter